MVTPDHIMCDYVDGEHYKQHPLFSIHSDALQIFFYYDDLEVCNPLGSKAKIHQLSKLVRIAKRQKIKLLIHIQVLSISHSATFNPRPDQSSLQYTLLLF